jgi:NADH-quinone oxidoreductase subunit F
VSLRQNTLFVCIGGQSCRQNKSRAVLKAFQKRIAKKQLENVCAVEQVDCLGFCKQGPVVQVAQTGLLYGNVKPDDCKKILKRHLTGRKPLKRLMLKPKSN